MHGEPPQDANGPPKADSEVETLHEKVTKQIIKEGHGQKPSKYSTCFCKCQIVAYFCTSGRFTSSISIIIVFFWLSFLAHENLNPEFFHPPLIRNYHTIAYLYTLSVSV